MVTPTAEIATASDSGLASDRDSDNGANSAAYPLHADGLPGVPLTDGDRTALKAKRALTDAFLDIPRIAETVRSITDADAQLPRGAAFAAADDDRTGLLYRWLDPKTNEATHQFRPSTPRSPEETKYHLEPGKGQPTWLVSGPIPDLGYTAYLVEGTHQGLAWACAYAHDPSAVVVSLQGRTGGLRGGVLHPGVAHVVRRAKTVVVVPDGDAASNREVYDSFHTLGERIRAYLRANGNRSHGTVRFVQIPTTADNATAGADDYLRDLHEHERHTALEELVALALNEPAAVRPPRYSRNPEDQDRSKYFHPFTGGLRTEACAEAILDGPALLIDEYNGVINHYSAETGLFLPDRNTGAQRGSAAVSDPLGDLLGNDYRASFVASVEDLVRATLARRNAYLPERPRTDGLLPTEQGLVDMESRETFPHSPEARITSKLAVVYDPNAVAPQFEEWLATATRLTDGSDQKDIILDGLTTLLETAAGLDTPTIALYLYGPPRAGKGTLGKLIQAMVPPSAQASMSLSEMAIAKPFEIADLYRKLLNISGETSDSYISDTSLMKKVFGEDFLRGELKFGRSWLFKNTAASVFMGNDLPHISDVSGAVGARIQPIKFTSSHVGEEDRNLYPRLLDELPGILNLVIDAWRARKARGGAFLPAAPEAVEAFIESTNPVAGFMRDRVEKAPEEAWVNQKTGAPSLSVDEEWGTSPSELYTAYKGYCDQTGSKALKRDNFVKAVTRKPFALREGRTRDSKRRVLGCRLVREESGNGINMSLGNGFIDIARTHADVSTQSSVSAVRAPVVDKGSPVSPPQSVVSATPSPQRIATTAPDAFNTVVPTVDVDPFAEVNQ